MYRSPIVLIAISLSSIAARQHNWNMEPIFMQNNHKLKKNIKWVILSVLSWWLSYLLKNGVMLDPECTLNLLSSPINFDLPRLVCLGKSKYVINSQQRGSYCLNHDSWIRDYVRYTWIIPYQLKRVLTKRPPIDSTFNHFEGLQ